MESEAAARSRGERSRPPCGQPERQREEGTAAAHPPSCLAVGQSGCGALTPNGLPGLRAAKRQTQSSRVSAEDLIWPPRSGRGARSRRRETALGKENGKTRSAGAWETQEEPAGSPGPGTPWFRRSEETPEQQHPGAQLPTPCSSSLLAPRYHPTSICH